MLCCWIFFSLATCLLYLSYMLDLMGDYVATAQIAGYFLLCFGDFTFLAFVNSLFALIYREVMQHMRVQELDFALRTARSLSPTAFGLLRRSSARTVEWRERLRQKYKCSYEGIFNKSGYTFGALGAFSRLQISYDSSSPSEQDCNLKLCLSSLCL